MHQCVNTKFQFRIYLNSSFTTQKMSANQMNYDLYALVYELRGQFVWSLLLLRERVQIFQRQRHLFGSNPLGQIRLFEEISVFVNFLFDDYFLCRGETLLLNCSIHGLVIYLFVRLFSAYFNCISNVGKSVLRSLRVLLRSFTLFTLFM